MGPFREALLNAALWDLSKELERRGNALCVMEPEGSEPSEVAHTLVSLALAAGATLLTYVEEVAPEEREQEAALRQLAVRRGLAVKAYAPSTLVDFGDLPFAPEKAPNVFTAFRLAAEKKGSFPAPCEVPDRLPKPGGPGGEVAWWRFAQAVTQRVFQSATQSVAHSAALGAVRSEALARLHCYLWETDAAQTYFDTRNKLSGDLSSTRFSPWLSLGVLDAREVNAAVCAYEQERGSNKSTRWIVFELLWRDFFKVQSLKHGVRLYCEGGLEPKAHRGARTRVLSKQEEEARFAAWREGRTGLPLVDAAMRELAFSGWLSNRARQIVASALVYGLGVRWTWGAWHFESLLVDYDPASNWGNWAYIAGRGNDPRGGRVFDVEKQAALYDPQGCYVRAWGAAVPTFDNNT